ncbi:hypothetical protein, partial [Chroogloeocystis siderophila]|uniref:hypothetical protein n=1 Tax=Chroogloeocystis siderophila TaxID=329163 RepID=UPI0015B88D8D
PSRCRRGSQLPPENDALPRTVSPDDIDNLLRGLVVIFAAYFETLAIYGDRFAWFGRSLPVPLD